MAGPGGAARSPDALVLQEMTLYGNCDVKKGMVPFY